MQRKLELDVIQGTKDALEVIHGIRREITAEGDIDYNALNDYAMLLLRTAEWLQATIEKESPE